MRALRQHAEQLHARYMHREAGDRQAFVKSPDDVLAYLCLRFPATYAQIYGALAQIKERNPDWKPARMLDVGCGPGTAIWVAKELWPSINDAVGVDQVQHFLSVADEFATVYRETLEPTWVKASFLNWVNDDQDTNRYDLVVVASVINELPGMLKEQVLTHIAKKCSGLLLIIEPGTKDGVTLIERFAKTDAIKLPLFAPYIDQTFVSDEKTWIHFSQRFQRPDFMRLIRQSMRDSSLMASDWEEATYAYVARGSVPTTVSPWGVTIGKVEKYKGYLIVPVLTAEGIVRARVLKRHKDIYHAAKELRWGELLKEPIVTS